jgi:hypothetical protein
VALEALDELGLATAGVPAPTIQEMGHTWLITTQRYMHVLKDGTASATAALEASTRRRRLRSGRMAAGIEADSKSMSSEALDCSLKLRATGLEPVTSTV